MWIRWLSNGLVTGLLDKRIFCFGG